MCIKDLDLTPSAFRNKIYYNYILEYRKKDIDLIPDHVLETRYSIYMRMYEILFHNAKIMKVKMAEEGKEGFGSSLSLQYVFWRRKFKKMKRATKSVRGGNGVAWTRKDRLGKGKFGFISLARPRALPPPSIMPPGPLL